MILLIDNYDSFSYNLYQLVGAVASDIQVIRNDACTVEEIAARKPEAILLSPGPGRPADAGVCIPLIRYYTERAASGAEAPVPILGVCLGHQAICEAMGGTVSYARELMHGKQSEIFPTKDSLLLAGLGPSFPAARYHSLAVIKETVPPSLRITATSADGEVMAVEGTDYPLFGVQFHPESVMTPCGRQLMENFIRQIRPQTT